MTSFRKEKGGKLFHHKGGKRFPPEIRDKRLEFRV